MVHFLMQVALNEVVLSVKCQKYFYLREWSVDFNIQNSQIMTDITANEQKTICELSSESTNGDF